MAGMSDYLELKLVNWLRGTAMGASPSGLYVALFNGDPTDTAIAATEVTTTIRAAGRVAATFGAPNASNVIANSAIIDFGAAAGAATISHMAVFDAAAGGNMMWSWPVSGGGAAFATLPVSFAIGTCSFIPD